jgi:hypothetical protein
MTTQKIHRIILIATLILTGTLLCSGQAQAQTEQASPASAKVKNEDSAGLEVQLHLLIATKSVTVDEEKLPSSLDAVVKQLRSTFTFKSYRLVTTLLNRVSNHGKLNLRWVGSPLLAQSAATLATPGINEFNVQEVALTQDEQGRDIVQMSNFRFGARIPIQVSSVASTGSSVPVVQYEQTGITTDISLREGEPTIVGTLNVGPSGESLIIVVSAKRAGPR